MKHSFKKSYYPQLQKKLSELNLFKSVFDQTKKFVHSSWKRFYEKLSRNNEVNMSNSFGYLLKVQVSIKEPNSALYFHTKEDYELFVETN